MKILSLFDGISCGRLALQRAGIPVEKYYASEIDKYAIKVTMANFPDTIQLGDVTKIDFKQFVGKIDLLIGGSPCQDLSLSGKRAGLKGERSGLFYKFVEALNVIKPKYFLLENNVGMPKEAYNEISRLMGCYPIDINSALVSAQSRRRYYWTNIRLRKVRLFGIPHSDIPQPKDKNIILQDILEDGIAYRHKSLCCLSSDGNFATHKDLLNRWTRHQEAPAKAIRVDDTMDSNGRNAKGYRIYHVLNGYVNLCDSTSPQNETENLQCYNLYSKKDKSATLMTSEGEFSPCSQGVYRISLPDGYYIICALSPVEYERLQTLPDNYTDKGISNTQRYKCIGNGWTVDVISHIFSFLKPII